MHGIKVITCGDKNYFKFLFRFEQNVFKQFGFYPIIYDLGLTSAQKMTLRSEVREVCVPDDYDQYNKNGFIKTTHKPNCINDFLHSFKEDCLYLDADILLSKKMSSKDLCFENADVAVTPRHVDERYERLYSNGLINAGFLYFKNNKRTKEFVNFWNELCVREDATDQLALSNYLKDNNIDVLDSKSELFVTKNISVKLLDACSYNDVSLSSGLVLHYKNAGRSAIAYERYQMEFFLIQNSIPLRWLIKIYFRLRSKLFAKKKL